MIDNGCLTYCLITESFARRVRATRTTITPVLMDGVNEGQNIITEMARFELDLDGYRTTACAYITPYLLGHDMILGQSWLKEQRGVIDTVRDTITLGKPGIQIASLNREPTAYNHYQVAAVGYQYYVRRARQPKSNLQVFAASLKDIQKALAPRKKIDLEQTLPRHYQDYQSLFSPHEADKLPPQRGQGIDHAIELEQIDGKEAKPSYGPLYSMSRDELLVLRRTLMDLLDKGFIRVSNSSASSPVLFVRKGSGGLRFCVDYRALNAITRKDRYPLPLIKETLNQIARAKWFTKLDVTAAFHRIRIAEGDEWMTAFRTRYGLFEWLVTPFGLANAPSTFQKYINHTLQDLLDDFVSAYLDDILIFTDGSLSQHQEHVRIVLDRLKIAGLHLDISKCEFDQTRTKYLGFVIDAETGIHMDPEKVEAIQQWTAPTTLKGVRGFLGFANFYRRFIPGFSRIVNPLVRLTKKDVPFQFGPEEELAFDTLKRAFLTDENLVPFHSERETILEADASGWAMGGTLSQRDEEGVLRTCAYFSKRFIPAECNYPIYDKELLAIIRCLEEWDAELRSVQKFLVVTDHKNLQYFTSPRKLSERHARWSIILSRYNFTIQYRPGSDNDRADALSRRDQDIPADEDDERTQSRTFQLLKVASAKTITPVRAKSVTDPTLNSDGNIVSPTLPSPPDMETLLSERWQEARTNDPVYQIFWQTVKQEKPQLPPSVRRNGITLGDCSLDEDQELCYRTRKWVPDDEELRTGIMQNAHLSLHTGHPGREETYRIITVRWFWPQMTKDVRRFVANCDLCRQSKSWRQKKHGLLRPLPVPSRTWKDLSVDFIDKLPPSSGCTSLMVIKDRLGRGLKLIPMQRTKAVDVAWAFIRDIYGIHGIPSSIVSDRGVQFVNDLWGTVCTMLGTRQKLSTAYHPQTDGGTEKANDTIEIAVRIYCNKAQNNWASLCPILQLMLNSRTSAVTGISPFFLMHGYDNRPFDPVNPLLPNNDEYNESISMKERGESIVRKIQQAAEWAIVSSTYEQQQMEGTANRSRQPAPRYKVGDQVWLDLRNIRTQRRSKKFDWKAAKYTVTRIWKDNPSIIELDVPGQLHRTFHVDLIRPAAMDPFPSQRTNDSAPAPLVVRDKESDEDHIEYIIEEVKDEYVRGGQVVIVIKWEGYPDSENTVEILEPFLETTAYKVWLRKTQHLRNSDGKLTRNWRRQLEQ
jgi:hypothetical protein